MKQILFLILAILLLVGCAAFKDTVRQIAENPKPIIQEAAATANVARTAVPELPYVVCIGIGYAAAFVRRWYQNIKRQQSNIIVSSK